MKLKIANSQDFLIETLNSINDFILNYLSLQEIESLAHQTQFVIRTSAILKGYDFLLMALVCSKGDTHNTLEDMVDVLEKYSGFSISKQSLAEKIDSAKGMAFLTTCLQVVQRKKINHVLDQVSPEVLTLFSKILLQDSTIINLHEKLSKFFKGSGGRASRSALKLDLIYDLKSKEFVSFIITDMKTVDQNNSKEILKFVDINTLVIRDLGYLQVDVFLRIIEKGAYFLSRFKIGLLVFLNKEDTQPVDLCLFLEREFAINDIVDLDIYITEKKLPVRMVVYRCSKTVTEKRRREANGAAKKQGRTVSKIHQTLSKYTIFITNVSRDVWKAEIIGTIYILRWQIELIFKSWKSKCQIHVLKGTKPHRIQVLILSKLIQLSLFTIIYGIVQRYCEVIFGREISMYKVFCWLKGEDEFYKILSYGMGERELKRLIKRSIMDQRTRRKSSWANVKEQTSFITIYKEKTC